MSKIGLSIKESSLKGGLFYVMAASFIRSGLNFNAATQIFTYIKARSWDRAFLLPEIYKGACDMYK